ncbi:MAG: succinylglutamate desuccinylase/aspartoacylase family protein [Myxococcota bacterium]
MLTAPPSASVPVAVPPAPLEIAGESFEAGVKRRVEFETSESFAGVRVAMPVVVTRGTSPGPVLCLTAGIHGDELIGVEAVRRVSEGLTPEMLRGTVVAVPIVNPHGFRRSSRYLPDRRDLNRFFPGREGGSSASRIALRVFEGVIRRCSYLVDFHTGSFHRTNMPHVRADLRNERVVRLTRWFRAPLAIHSVSRSGTLRRAAVEAGIPAITFEVGEPMRFEEEGIEAGVAGSMRLMAGLGMVTLPPDESPPTELYFRSSWVRVDDGGILLTSARLGAQVEKGQALGTVTDPMSDHRAVVTSPYSGRIVGMALNQVVIPGFAAFHLALEPIGAIVPVDIGVDEETVELWAPEDELRPEE